MRAIALGLSIVLGASVAHGGQRVAVLPFKDLSGERGSIGEAISETVTSDLREVPGVKVIERANVDRILGELNLKASRAELDPPSALKVGQLLSATLIVVGSYQKVGANVRINARFVNVETSEVAGTAKVDGPSSTFFTLQDRITTELLKSAGIDSRHVQRFAQRTRPRLKSLKAVELYGDAVIEPDDARKKQILVAALKEDPALEYATRDLDALEQRLRAYAARAQGVEDRKVTELKGKLATEADGDKRAILCSGLFATLLTTRRYHQMRAEARALTASPGAPTSGYGLPKCEETAGYYLVMAELYLHDWDGLLGDGEKYLKRNAGSVYYGSVQGYVTQVITRKRKEDEGKAKLAELLNRLTGHDRVDVCYLAALHRDFAQYEEARRLFRLCLSSGTKPRKEALHDLVAADIEVADWAGARADLAALEKENDADLGSLRTWWDASIPTDG